MLHQNGDRKAPKLSASELPPEPKEIKLDAAALGDYVGKYRFNFGILDVVLRATLSKRSSPDSPPSRSLRAPGTSSSYKAVDAQLDFQRDGGGKIVAAVLHQNGRNMRAPRMTDQ